MRRYELRNEQWDKLKPYFEIPNKKGRAYKNVRNTVLRRYSRNWIAIYKMFLSTARQSKFIKTLVLKKELIGKSRGGSSTKIHAVVDALGNPLKVVLSAGQVHDITVAPQLICDLEAATVMAEAAYDSLRGCVHKRLSKV